MTPEKDFSIKNRHYQTARNTQLQSSLPQTIGELTGQNTQTPRTDVCNDCFQLKFTLILQTKDICRPIAGGKSPLFVAIITCTVERSDVRDVIRNTWGSYSRSNTAFMRYFFIVGRSDNATLQDALVLENDVYHDIVQYDFEDSYRNLTIKTMMGLQHAVKYCKTAEFVLKTDSDVYVNVPAFSHLLHSYEPTSSETGGQNLASVGEGVAHIKPLQMGKEQYQFIPGVITYPIAKAQNGIFGLMWKGSPPIRNASSPSNEKWVVSKTEFPRNVYPKFLDGHGYVLPYSVARAVVGVSKDIPFFKLEDVYIGLCLEALGHEIEHTSGFLRVHGMLTVCSHKFDYVYLVHGLNSTYMRKVWETTCPRTGHVQFERPIRRTNGSI